MYAPESIFAESISVLMNPVKMQAPLEEKETRNILQPIRDCGSLSEQKSKSFR